MRNPEYNDKLSEYSAADRAIMQASINAARLANKKAPAKKAVAKKVVAKKAVAKKAAAPKPTDSRFSGIKKTTAAPKMPSKGPAAKVATTKQKPRFGGFSIAAGALTPDWKKREQAAKAKKSK